MHAGAVVLKLQYPVLGRLKYLQKLPVHQRKETAFGRFANPGYQQFMYLFISFRFAVSTYCLLWLLRITGLL